MLSSQSRVAAVPALQADQPVGSSSVPAKRVDPPQLRSVAEDGGTIVCYSHLRWDFVFQRPQHLLTRAARTAQVLFVEEPLYEAGVDAHLSVTPREIAGGKPIKVAVPILPEGMPAADAVREQRQLVGAFLKSEAEGRITAWFYSPMALAYANDLPADLVVYDCMDELSAFRGAPPELTFWESKLYERADVVLTGGMSLYEAKRGRHPNVHAFPSSIDTAHFGCARAPGQADPADQAFIPHPRVGFFGVIDERMDIELVGRVAALRPDVHFVMLGPVVKIDPASLPQAPNLHWLGSKPYSELPAYLAGWDAGFMPFARNESTRFISPTKTPEFLAAGVPVVSTSITDVIRPYGDLDLVAIADKPEEMARAIDRQISRDRSRWLTRVDRHLAQNSWDRTWAGMVAAMTEASAAKRARAAVPALATPPRSGPADLSKRPARPVAASIGPVSYV